MVRNLLLVEVTVRLNSRYKSGDDRPVGLRHVVMARASPIDLIDGLTVALVISIPRVGQHLKRLQRGLLDCAHLLGNVVELHLHGHHRDRRADGCDGSRDLGS